MKLSRTTFTWALVSLLFVAAVFALAGNPIIPPEMFAGLAAVGMAGEMDIKGIQEMLQKHNDAYGEFMRKNDELLKAKADGKSLTDLQATVDKINADLTKFNADLVEMAKKANRPGTGGDGKGITPEQAEYKAAVSTFIRTGKSTEDLTALHRKAYGVKAYNSSSVPDGGIFVTTEMDTAILELVRKSSGIANLARQVTIGTDMWKKRVKTSGMAARRIKNGGTGGESDTPKFGYIEIPVFTAETEPQVENETLDDADYNIEADLSMEAGMAFADLAGTEFVSGTGVQEARGLLGYSTVANASYAWGKIGFVKSGASGAFASTAPGDALIDLQHSLKRQYRSNAAFVTNDSSLAKVRQMKDGSGAYYLWQPDPLSGFSGRILGNPVELDDYMPDIASASFSIAYGDIAQAYAVVNRTGTVVIRDNVTSKGVTKYNFRRRFGGGVINFEAVKLMQFSA